MDIPRRRIFRGDRRDDAKILARRGPFRTATIILRWATAQVVSVFRRSLPCKGPSVDYDDTLDEAAPPDAEVPPPLESGDIRRQAQFDPRDWFTSIFSWKRSAIRISVLVVINLIGVLCLIVGAPGGIRSAPRRRVATGRVDIADGSRRHRGRVASTSRTGRVDPAASSLRNPISADAASSEDPRGCRGTTSAEELYAAPPPRKTSTELPRRRRNLGETGCVDVAARRRVDAAATDRWRRTKPPAQLVVVVGPTFSRSFSRSVAEHTQNDIFYLSFPLFLLLGMRANIAYQHYWEARRRAREIKKRRRGDVHL